MGLFDSYKIKKAVDVILDVGPASTADSIQATLTLKKVGPSAIQYILDALTEADHVGVFEMLLEHFISNKHLDLFLDALAYDDRKAVPVIKRILAKSGKIDPNHIVEALERGDIRKEYLTDIIRQQADHVDQHLLLELLYHGTTGTRQVVFDILQSIGSEKLVPDLIEFAQSESADTRYRVAKLMSTYSFEDVRTCLFHLLKDPNKNVRMAALEGLATMNIPVPTKLICQLLRDSDLMVQSKAIETLIKLNDASTVKYLIEYLQDESEYIRRAAVEVLNEVGDARAIKDLLMALRDEDWWVRVRAADALGSIGGPRVVDAVLALIKDDDPFLRRTAVEILNTSKDDRAFDSLVSSLKDEDWWVRERAADALASMGNERAVEPLRELLGDDPQTMQVAIRALATLGSKDVVKDLIKALNNTNSAVQKEAITALSQLADESNARDVQKAVTQLITLSNDDVKELARETASDLADRFKSKTQVISRNEVDTISNDATLIDVAAQARKNQAATSVSHGVVDEPVILIDADRLQPGDYVGERYKVIKRVGKGGFGTVVLVHDEMVDDEYILKFLNPAFVSDDSVVKRFTHELRYSRKVTHENIIRIYDFLTFGRSYAISMEYFPSHSLADELDKNIPGDTLRMIRILREICKGMASAQQVNVVHRDLKPANILIDDDNLVKIVDFGLAAAASEMDSRITKTGVLVGTPTYMAPEQARGEEIDSRTDIYSLGVIMYRIFTGRAPYEEKDPMSTLLKHVEGKARPIRELNPDLPERLEQIVLKSMKVKASERYQHFDELAADFELLIQEMG